MSNKLSNIFSDKMFKMNLNIGFRDNETHDEFLNALKIVQDEGRAVEVKGEFFISTSVKDGEMIYPYMIESPSDQLIIGPSIEPVELTIDTVFGKKTVIFERYTTTDNLIIRTNNNEIVFLMFEFGKQTQKVHFTYRLQSQYAKKIRDVVEGFGITIGVFNKLFRPDAEQEHPDVSDSLHTMMRIFQNSYDFWYKLSLIENELNLFFDPAKIGNIKENVQDVEELYQLLIEKKAIRLDKKFSSTETKKPILPSDENILKVGQKIAMTFIGEVSYSICEQNITIYTANLLENAIIKEIVKNESGGMKVLYDDTDSAPMYVSYTGHKSEEEAKIEHDLIMKDNEHTKKYKDALTVFEYLRKNEIDR